MPMPQINLSSYEPGVTPSLSGVTPYKSASLCTANDMLDDMQPKIKFDEPNSITDVILGVIPGGTSFNRGGVGGYLHLRCRGICISTV